MLLGQHDIGLLSYRISLLCKITLLQFVLLSLCKCVFHNRVICLCFRNCAAAFEDFVLKMIKSNRLNFFLIYFAFFFFCSLHSIIHNILDQLFLLFFVTKHF